MADLMRIQDSVPNVIDFAPAPGYDDTGDIRASRNVTLDGTLYIYIWGTKKRWEVPVNGVSEADKIRIESWHEAGTELTFYPNYADYPSQTTVVRIVNADHPLQMQMPFFNDLYEGTLILRQSS